VAEPATSFPAFQTVLVIAHSNLVRAAVRGILETMGLGILEATAGAAGIAVAAARTPDVVVLDPALADLPGTEVCGAIRATSCVPIIAVAQSDAERDKVALLDAGADDYITLPLRARELAARVRVQLRHADQLRRPNEPSTVTLDDVRIDFAHGRVIRGDRFVQLTALEWRLLRAMASRAGEPVSHRELFATVWNRSYGDPQLYLTVHITKLRRKIEPSPSSPRLVITVPRVGYQFIRPR